MFILHFTYPAASFPLRARKLLRARRAQRRDDTFFQFAPVTKKNLDIFFERQGYTIMHDATDEAEELWKGGTASLRKKYNGNRLRTHRALGASGHRISIHILVQEA